MWICHCDETVHAGMLSQQRTEDTQSKLLAMNQYYNAAAVAAAAADPSMSPASAISLIQAAMTPPPALQGMSEYNWLSKFT